jgi:hypothetical protein
MNYYTSHFIILPCKHLPFQSAPPVGTSSWRQLGLTIVKDAAFGGLGYSVALSADARTLLIGAPGYADPDRKGYVKVYRSDEDGGNRVQLGKTIYGNATGDLFGYSVDITADGNFIILGSPGTGMYVGDMWEYDRPGYVRVFPLDSDDESGTNGTWKQIGQDIIGEAIGDQFG